MAPRKEKAEKNSADAGTTMIMDYLTQAAKTLKALRESNLISGKDSGKQSIYHTLQPPSSPTTPTHLATLDTRIATLRSTLAELKAEEKTLRASLVSLNATLSTEELRGSVAGLEQAKVGILGRLEALRGGNVRPVGRGEREGVMAEWTSWKKKAEVRKKIGLELWKMLSEDVPEGMTRDDLWEQWGLEADSS